MTEILYGMRPEIGKYCWNNTIFKGKDEVEVPEEIVTSYVEVQEEMMQKLTHELDQMYIEDNDEGNEDEYVELIEVPDSDTVSQNATENGSENPTVKNKVQSKITSFFNNKK